jgi:DNA-binding MarR family transcriptional regulator
LVDAIERIIIAGVAMTNAALSSARPGLDLSFQQWRVLVVLGERPNGLAVREISRLIDVTLPATGRQLRRLERRGLVLLEPDQHDRRVTRVRLTDAGLDARASIMSARRQRLATLVGRPPAGRAPSARLLAGLEELAMSLDSSTGVARLDPADDRPA